MSHPLLPVGLGEGLLLETQVEEQSSDSQGGWSAAEGAFCAVIPFK